MGRTKENPRYNVISLRLADDELVLITERAAATKTPKGNVIRELALAMIKAETAPTGAVE